MLKYEFTDDCLIGIPEIDQEHRKLFEIINEAFAVLEKAPDSVSNIAEPLLADLKEYAASHFAHEEAYMEQMSDPELESQRREHAAFVHKLESFGPEALHGEKAADTFSELLPFLVRWLYRHILSSDMMIGKMAAEESGSEDPFAFTAKYHTGIELIDNEHSRLFEIIRSVNDLIHAEFLHDKYDEIMGIMGELRDYTELHFSDEEAYMEQIGYPGLVAQKQAHAAFVERLVTIDLSELDEIDDNQQQYLLELVIYLLDWLSNHILIMDKKIAEYKG